MGASAAIRLLVFAVVGALAAAVAAGAATVVKYDNSGRSISFEVMTPVIDVDWYAALLSSAAHGDEISTVTFRIVPESRVREHCGAGTLACYRRGPAGNVITVPEGRSADVAHSVIHEYGHHLDAAWAVGGRDVLDGTPVWWAGRGIDALLAAGRVALDHSLGWNRNVGEIFAEDYAYLHLRGEYAIPWLSPPGDALRSALLAEWGATIGTPPAMRPVATAAPVVLERSGVLAAGGRRQVGFALPGPERRVTVSATVDAGRVLPSAGIAVACDGVVVGRARVESRRTVSLVRTGLGPAACEASIFSLSPVRQAYALSVRVSG